MFKQLPDIHVDSSKHKPISPVNVLHVNATVVKEERGKGNDTYLSLSTKELIDAQSNGTFCSTVLKLINDKTPLHESLREDAKLFYALVVPIIFNEYVLHQSYETLGHNGTARTYWCLWRLYYEKRLCKDVNIHVKQCMKYKEQNLHPQHYVQLHLVIAFMPVHFIAIDLIGRFKLLPQGYQYALTGFDMLTNCT